MTRYDILGIFVNVNKAKRKVYIFATLAEVKNVQARAVKPAENRFEYPWVTRDIDSVHIEILV